MRTSWPPLMATVADQCLRSWRRHFRSIPAAVATDTALEVNGALPRLDLSVEHLRRAMVVGA